MRYARILPVGLAFLTFTACSDEPTQPELTEAPEVQLAQGPVANTGLLNNIPISETLPGGSTLEGLLSITDLSFENGQLLASGTLTGTITDALGTVTQFTQTFTDTALGLTGSGSGATCDILNLDLGPLNLDLLGLVVDLSAISLDITAVRGPGNLLGNLLCAVAGLLDGNGPLSGILNLLDQINSLLG